MSDDRITVLEERLAAVERAVAALRATSRQPFVSTNPNGDPSSECAYSTLTARLPSRMGHTSTSAGSEHASLVASPSGSLTVRRAGSR